MESTAHWPQDIGAVKPMDQASSKQPNNNLIERRTRPQKDQALNCPRCNSTNTKFCYYNNYSLTQPRYFCKTCRRYWTEGGSLRNVPVGGGSRKNKRSSSSSSSTTSSSSSSLPLSSASKTLADHHHHHHTVPIPPSLNFLPAHQNPKLIHQGQDLNLAYPPTSTHHHDHQDYHHDHHNGISRSPYVEVPYSATTPSTTDNHDQNKSHNQNPSSTTTTTSAMELLKSGINYNASRNHGLISSFMSMPVHGSNTLFSTGFLNLAQDQFKPSLSFGLDHGYNNNHHGDQSYDHGNLDHRGPVQETGGARLLFPSDQDLKQVASTTTTTTNSSDHHRHQFELNKGQGDMSNGYNWNGMLGHGGSW